ncbi:MAG: DUF3786 domain-containing protein [Chloroflexi bacterium]|nr:DUF3786 domain-containing protein [Chloroflexota bacterium]
MSDKKVWLLGEPLLEDAAPNPLAERADEMRAELQNMNPERVALRTGAIYTPAGDTRGAFKLTLWDKEVLFAFPAFSATDAHNGAELNPFDQTMLLYYFHLSDGTPQSGTWIAFTELPDGKFYTQAFQGYTGQALTQAFGNDTDAFSQAAEQLNGRREFFGNLAYSFQVLPRLSLMVACWLGDEDFPASYRVLFDASAGHHLTTDACAILGSQLTQMLIKAR